MADTLNSGSATPKSKSLATWLALLGGLLGAHRFYLHGWRDGLAWLHPVLSLIGLAGVIRMRNPDRTTMPRGCSSRCSGRWWWWPCCRPSSWA